MDKKELRAFIFKEMKGIMAGSRLGEKASSDGQDDWQFPSVAGRMIEIQDVPGTAALSQVTRLIRQAQEQTEPVAWITLPQSSFYPPDLVEAGVDLERLPVIKAPTPIKAAGIADTLVRSDGFSLVILDLSEQSNLPTSTQTRLAGLARQHQTALVCLSAPQQPLDGALVSLRIRVQHERSGFNEFKCQLEVTKDKKRNQRWQQLEVRRGPDGMC